MTAEQLTLEEQIRCHGLRDGRHYMVEYYDSVFIYVYVIDISTITNGVIRDTIC